jgi:hypothetical protein
MGRERSRGLLVLSENFIHGAGSRRTQQINHFEILLVSRLAEGPSTELMVCRRRSSPG